MAIQSKVLQVFRNAGVPLAMFPEQGSELEFWQGDLYPDTHFA